MSAMLRGGCQCGEVRYECGAEPTALFVCHCRECQKQSGSAFGMSLQVPRDALRVIAGSPRHWTRPTDSGHHLQCWFCDRCGSRMWHEPVPASGTCTIKAGSLDEPVDFSAAVHIWTSRRLPGLSFPDHVSQFPEGPP